MRYFKVKTGYGAEDFIPITEKELDSALYAFVTDSKIILDGGPVNGKNIITITEDWHRAMGWNYGYKMGPEDFEDIQALDYKGVIAQAKARVTNLIKTGQTNLIGREEVKQIS